MEDNEKEEKKQELKDQDVQEQEEQKQEGQGSNQEQQESKQEQQGAEEDLNLDDVIPKKQIKITLTTAMIILVGVCMIVILAIILIVGNSRREDSVYYEDYDSVDYFDVDDCDDSEYKYQSDIYVTPLEKPIIYIYPTEETEVTVKLGKPEKLAVSYPKYKEEGWKILAKTDGTLIDSNSGRSLYALYWEGREKERSTNDIKEGFIVEGENTAKFLEEKLAILGLNEREAEEFIVYWLPQMENNKFNYIRFESLEEIEEVMPLEINPKPDTLIRIMMEWEPLDEKIEIEEQKLEKAERDGYTVVEWGGTKLK